MSLFYLVERLDPRVFDAEVLFLGNEGPAIDFFQQRGVKTRVLDGIAVYPHAYGARMSFVGRKPLAPLSRFLSVRRSVKKMLLFFQQYRFDIVHVNTSLLLAVGKAASLSGAKVVWHVRESLHPGVLGFRRWVVRRWIKRYADWVIAISTFERDALDAGDKVTVVYNYVDFKKFNREIPSTKIRSDFGLSDKFVVCNLGGAVHSKGGDVFVNAAISLCQKYDDISFLLVGIVNEKPASSRIISRLKRALGLSVDLSGRVLDLVNKGGFRDRILIAGVRTDIPEILAASDVLVWSATVPHFARPIIEAGAMAKSVIASDFPNTREAMIPDVTGLLFEPGSCRDLAEKIERLYRDHAVMDALGEKGFELAHERFNGDRNFSEVNSIYMSLMNGDHERT